MPHETTLGWPARQMYSRSHPIGRTHIFAGFAGVLAALAGAEVDPAAKIEECDVPGMEYLGYSATRQTWRLTAGGASLDCTIDPICASMGVSGENHSWVSKGLPDGVVVQGRALSSGRQPGSAHLTIEGVDAERAAVLSERFKSAFGRILSDEELEQELGER